MLGSGSLKRLRYVGLAGSSALAAGAYQVGALPGRAATDELPGLGQACGTIACLAGLLTLTVAWWRIGRRTADGPGLAPSGRWMVGTACLWFLPLLVAPPLASRDVYAYGCQGAAVRAGADPHVTAAADLPCPWLSSVPPIWQDAASPYGPLFTLLSAAAVGLSGGQLAAVVILLRLLALTGIVLAVRYGGRLATSCGVSPGRAGWLGLASPLVAVHAVSGAHNDALMAGLVITALAVAAGQGAARGTRWGDLAGRCGLAGLALGLAVAVKASALVALPFVALLATGEQGGTRAGRRLAQAAGSILAATAATYAALATVSGLGLGFLRGLASTGESAQWTSVPTAVGMAVGYLLRAAGVESGYPVAVTVARAVGVAAVVAVVAVLWWRAWREPGSLPPAVAAAGPPAVAAAAHTVAASGVAFAAVVMLGPVFYPWYALTPLALLAISVVADKTRAWLGAAAGAFAFLVLPNGAGLAARTKLPGAVVVTAAVAAVAWRRVRRRRPARPRPRASSTPARSRRRDPRPGP